MEQPKKPKAGGLAKYVRFTGMGVQMALTIWLASLLGRWLDNKFETGNEFYFKVVTLLAVFGSIYSFIRQVIRLTNEDEH